MKKLNIVIAGATGYIGLELVKILSKHPKVNIKYLCAQNSIGSKISTFSKDLKRYKKLPRITNINNVNFNDISVVRYARFLVSLEMTRFDDFYWFIIF